jgi:hypothetical protein
MKSPCWVIKKGNKPRLSEMNKKIDTIEEKYFVTGEVNKEFFDKFRAEREVICRK